MSLCLSLYFCDDFDFISKRLVFHDSCQRLHGKRASQNKRFPTLTAYAASLYVVVNIS